jgi:hypothetical protein
MPVATQHDAVAITSPPAAPHDRVEMHATGDNDTPGAGNQQQSPRVLPVRAQLV